MLSSSFLVSREKLIGVRTVLLDIDQKTVLDKLPTADDAAFNSLAEGDAPTCHVGTRIDLLEQIYRWADDPRAEAIFWLNGMAGTGKSTISRTVARHFAARHRLGASFFFKRGDGDRGKVAKFFTTVASQLILAEPALGVQVKMALDSDPAVVRKTMKDQFEKLILEPLAEISRAELKTPSLVLVVDALDECERDDDVRLIISLFSRTKTLKSLPLRIFITSRPELPIRLGFNAIKSTYQDLVLHEIPEPVVEHDIGVYLEAELARIKDEYNNSVPEDRRLPANWPGPSKTKILIKMATPLFIFAATVCRSLMDRRCGNPDKQLGEIMEYQTRSQESQLDAAYLPVLNHLVSGLSGRKKDKLLEEFRRIVGSIVILESPLSTRSLARILRVSKDAVDDRLDLLQSVLSVPPSPDSPVRVLHLSFRDFLVDPEKRETNPFWVDEKRTHEDMATNCLQIMREHLHTDICGLEWPGTPRVAVSLQKIHGALPPEVQYACLYWVHHLQEAKGRIRDGDQVHDFLRHHCLHWLEALSFIRRVSGSVALIRALQALLEVSCYCSNTQILCLTPLARGLPGNVKFFL